MGVSDFPSPPRNHGMGGGQASPSLPTFPSNLGHTVAPGVNQNQLPREATRTEIELVLDEVKKELQAKDKAIATLQGDLRRAREYARMKGGEIGSGDGGRARSDTVPVEDVEYLNGLLIEKEESVRHLEGQISLMSQENEKMKNVAYQAHQRQLELERDRGMSGGSSHGSPMTSTGRAPSPSSPAESLARRGIMQVEDELKKTKDHMASIQKQKEEEVAILNKMLTAKNSKLEELVSAINDLSGNMLQSEDRMMGSHVGDRRQTHMADSADMLQIENLELKQALEKAGGDINALTYQLFLQSMQGKLPDNIDEALLKKYTSNLGGNVESITEFFKGQLALSEVYRQIALQRSQTENEAIAHRLMALEKANKELEQARAALEDERWQLQRGTTASEFSEERIRQLEDALKRSLSRISELEESNAGHGLSTATAMHGLSPQLRASASTSPSMREQQLQNQHDLVLMTCAELQEENTRLRTQVQDAEARATDMEKLIESQLGNWKGQLSVNTSKVGQMENQLESMKLEKKSNQHHVAMLEDSNSKKDERIHSLEQEVGQLRRERKDQFKGVFDEWEKTQEVNAARIRQLEKEVEEYRQHVELDKNNSGYWSQMYNNAVNELENTRRQLEQERMEKNALTQQTSQWTEEAARTHTVVDQLEQKLRKFEPSVVEVEKLRRELTSVKAEKDAAEAQAKAWESTVRTSSASQQPLRGLGDASAELMSPSLREQYSPTMPALASPTFVGRGSPFMGEEVSPRGERTREKDEGNRGSFWKRAL